MSMEITIDRLTPNALSDEEVIYFLILNYLIMRESKIQWTDATVNFWHGCKKVTTYDEQGKALPSECRYCYMYRDKDRYGQDPKTVIRSGKGIFYAALKWKEPKKIFTCSWSDFFIKDADQWRDDAWGVIRDTPHHEWQILTKRPERIRECLPDDWGDHGYSQVLLGVSIGHQGAIFRMPQLTDLVSDQSQFRTFLSLEPLLGPIDLLATPELRESFEKIDWVIIGGESGNNVGKHRFRPSELEWYTSIVDQCKEMGKPVFVKQLGTHLSKELGLKDRHGGKIEEFPQPLQLREFPSISFTILNQAS